jgi:anti-anti-sigma factor
VRFIDSTGLGIMVRAKKLAQREQVKLEFIHPQPSVQNVVHIAKLEQFLFGSPQKISTPIEEPAAALGTAAV